MRIQMANDVGEMRSFLLMVLLWLSPPPPQYQRVTDTDKEDKGWCQQKQGESGSEYRMEQEAEIPEFNGQE